MMRIIVLIVLFGAVFESYGIQIRIGKKAQIKEKEISFIAFQYFDRAGVPPGVGPAEDFPQALLRIDNDYSLSNPGDTVISSSLAMVIDSIHLEESDLYVNVTPLDTNLKEKEGKNIITLAGIGSKDTIHRSSVTIRYALIKASPGEPYFYNIQIESEKCGRDTIETLIKDASTEICGMLHTMLWDFKGYKNYVAYRNRFSVKPDFFGISFSVY